jgi:ABC-2 type transport system ATP-binding protein
MAAIEGPAGLAGAPSQVPLAPAIEAHALSKSYRDHVAVSSVDLTVGRGTVLGLLGPNGAGKTTLIRMLSTLLAPDSGSFQIAGLLQTETRHIRQRIGVLPESPGYPRWQTCQEWLTYHGRLYGASRRDARTTALRLLGEVGLTDRAGSLIAGLSRGMRQRLGIARSLVNEPDVVFLDEPTLGLDPHGQQQVLDLVTRIARDRGATVVLSAHVLAEVEQVCNHVVILNRGHVVADGTVAEVVRRAAAPRRGVVRVPSHLHTRAFDVLDSQGLVADGTGRNGHRDEVELRLPADEPLEVSATAALRCLLDAGVPVLGLTLEGGRLSDAFLAVTQGDGNG